MLKRIITCGLVLTLLSCGGGKHEAEVKDSRLGDSAAGAGWVDSSHSSNGERVSPLDTSGKAAHDTNR